MYFSILTNNHLKTGGLVAGHQCYKDYVDSNYFGAVILNLKVDTSNSTNFSANNLFLRLH